MGQPAPCSHVDHPLYRSISNRRLADRDVGDRVGRRRGDRRQGESCSRSAAHMRAAAALDEGRLGLTLGLEAHQGVPGSVVGAL